MENSTDQEFITGCIAGNTQVQEAFVKNFSDLVYRTVQYTFKNGNFPHSRLDVEDLHNTVFVKLFERKCKRLAQFKGKNGCRLSNWIRLIAARTVFSHLRKSNSELLLQKRKAVPLDALRDIRGEEPGALDLMEKTEQYELIERAMEGLKHRDRIFLKLHCIKGLSIRETSEIIGTSEATAYTIKHRAISRLKENIAQTME